MRVGLEIQLLERRCDRVVVQVRLQPPECASVSIDGAVVRLVDPEEEELCPRALVPISGTLSGPLLTQVELRWSGDIPPDSRIVAVAWSGTEQVEVRCPADPHLQLRDLVRGTSLVEVDTDVVLEEPTKAQWAAAEARWPWLTQTRAPEAGVIEADEAPSAEDLAEDYGLDSDCAEWLKDLMSEPD